MLGGVVGFLMTLASPRIYQARTTLEIQGYNNDFLNMGSVSPTMADVGYDAVADLQTHVRIIQSRSVRERAAGKLEQQPPPADLQPPDRLGMWRRALNLNPPSQEDLFDEALGTAAGGVGVRTSGVNRIVEVTCDSTNGQVAADYCNMLAQQYIDQNLESRWQSTEYTGQWLTKQLQDMKIKLEQSQEELQAYLRETGLIVTTQSEAAGDRANAQEIRLNDLLKELSAAQADRINKQSRYEMAVRTTPSGLPEVLDDESLQQSRKTLQDLQQKLAQLSVTFTPNHAEVKRVQAQIAALEGSLTSSRGDIQSRLRTEYEAAQRRESLLQGEYVRQAGVVSGQAEQTARYNLLKREVDASRELYDNLLQRTKEASIASALRANNIRVIDTAQRPSSPYSPNVPRQVTVGLMLGLVLGVAFAFVPRARRPDAAGSRRHHALPRRAGAGRDPGRGAAPGGTGEEGASGADALRVRWRIADAVAGGAGTARRDDRLVAARLAARRVVPHDAHVDPVRAPRRRAAARAGLQQREPEGRQDDHRLQPRDRAGRDQPPRAADRRRHAPSAAAQRIRPGQRDRAERPPPPEGAARPQGSGGTCAATRVPGLFVLTSGGSRRNASSLLHSARLPELLALARDRFDTVIVDTPPMVNLADARVVGRLADGVILVVRSGATTRDAAQLAVSRFADDGITVLGTVLNYWNPKAPGSSYYRYYYSGYYHYYGGGGDSDGAGGGSGSTADVKIADVEARERARRGLDLRPEFNRTPGVNES